MQVTHRIKVFTNKYPLIGPTFWMLSVQYFITQVVVADAWPQPYSLRFNAISDLGNTMCGQFTGRYVCSPEYAWMNASFIVLGLTIFIGAILLYHEFTHTTARLSGFILMAVAGIGTALVGLFPENVNPIMHALGAIMPFFFGNVALIVLGFVLPIPQYFKWFTVALGVMSLTALVLLYTHIYFGLGFGGMERIVAYPQTIWLIVFAAYVSQNRYRTARNA